MLREESERRVRRSDKEGISETVSAGYHMDHTRHRIDLHISKEVATTRQAYYYGVFTRDMGTRLPVSANSPYSNVIVLIPQITVVWKRYLNLLHWFWGSKSGCNESDVKPSWKDIEKAKACMLAKAQASEASSKAKVEACGSKAKLQASTKTLIVKSPVRITNCVLGLANAKTRDAIKGKTFGVKIQ
ncbi:hypothetical protein Tco_0735710 [Tanacetum coccineum]